jgi:hypothetical protein
MRPNWRDGKEEPMPTLETRLKTEVEARIDLTALAVTKTQEHWERARLVGLLHEVTAA